jgi:hypothetical protein
MYSAEADGWQTAPYPGRAPDNGNPSDRWRDFPYSQLSHHGAACCNVAREWVLAMDLAQSDGKLLSGPRWLRQKYKWGPSPWPMHWCEAVKRKTFDCGAHAALAHEVFRGRGLTSFHAQLVQKYSEGATEQWGTQWTEHDVSCHWLNGEHIYHEATALLVQEDELKIWDASAGAWINPHQFGGYGSLVAVRIWGAADWAGTEGLRWGERRLMSSGWNLLEY